MSPYVTTVTIYPFYTFEGPKQELQMENLSLLDKKDLQEILEEIIRKTIQDELSQSTSGNSNSPVLTRDEAAEMLDISLPTLLQWEKDNVIPKPKRLGKRVYFVRKDFISFLESNNNHKQ